MLSKGRVLAIDHGTYNVGLAISDPDRTIVFPRVTLRNDESLLDKIKKLVIEEEVSEIILGLPLHTDQSESRQTALVRQFAEKLKESVPCPLILRDEKLTTFDANEKIAASDSRQLVADKDQLAAMIILQEYLGLLDGN